MDLTVEDIYKPWKQKPIETKDYMHEVHEVLPDSKRMVWRKGDILLFGKGYTNRRFYDWREWFLTKKEKEKYRRFSPEIPKYARSQLAVIMCRYRITKNKMSGTFQDYGSYIMMISGTAPGYIRKYYMKSPYRTISKFPHFDIKSKKVKKLLNDLNMIKFIKNLYKNLGDSDESRTLFIEELQKKFIEEI